MRVRSLADVGSQYERKAERHREVVSNAISRADRGALDRADAVDVLMPAGCAGEVLVVQPAQPDVLIDHERGDVPFLKGCCRKGVGGAGTAVVAGTARMVRESKRRGDHRRSGKWDKGPSHWDAPLDFA